MTDFLSSKYDIDTIADIEEGDWADFQTDLQALISFFELSSHLKVRPTITDTVKSWRDSVQIPFRGTEVALCRTRGMTVIKTTFEAVEDLFVRALLVLYSHYSKGKTAVIASGSESGWDIARAIAEQATIRAGVVTATINVQEGRIKTTADNDGQAFRAIYDGPVTGRKAPLKLCPKIEKRWFF